LPWKTSDVDRHKTGLDAKGKRQWVAVANSALARCLADGGSAETCEPRAIRQANGVAGKATEAERLSGALGALLVEKGRVLSAKNESTLRAALASLQTVLAQLGQGETDDAAADEAIESARALVEAELSHNDTQQALRAAVAGGDAKRWVWVRDVFDSWFVYEDDSGDGTARSRLFKRTYVIADDGTVTLGDPTEVRVRTVYDPVGAPATESADVEVAGDVVPLVEKAVRRDNTVALKVIAPGWGSSGYYGADMLERDATVFKKGVKLYWNHPTATEEAERPERDLRDLAAELVEDARWEADGPAGPGVYADAKVFAPYRDVVEELAPHIGVSIRALGKATAGEAEGKKGPVIEAITAAKSVDFVTMPGAGGKVLSLFESARGRHQANREPEGSQVTEEEARALREANTAAVSRIGVLEARALKAEAQSFVAEQLGSLAEAARLPQAARQRVASAVLGDVPSKDGELDREALAARIKEAVVAEASYLVAIGGSGAIRGMGAAVSGEAPTPEQTTSRMVESFTRLGLPESAAKLAAAGRN